MSMFVRKKVSVLNTLSRYAPINVMPAGGGGGEGRAWGGEVNFLKNLQ